jgi:type II secretory pathway pseudopilin PulG
VKIQRKPKRLHSQRGAILLMLLIALALIIIAMGVAAPKMAQQIRRDRETEMIHRGVEYARAVKKFYKKFGRYPTSIEQLENTNNIRFLRKRYTDPMSPNGKWRLVRYGEVQLGQSGSLTPAVGGGAGGSLPGVVGGAFGQSSGNIGQQSQQPQQSQGGLGSFGSSQQGQQGSSFGSPVGGMFGSSGTGGVFWGGPILGVASTSQKQGIHEFDNKSKYSQWLFVYDPNQDRGQLITGPYNPKAFLGQANQVGTPAGQIGQPPSGGMFGGNSGFGLSPQNPPTQNPPAQNPQ